MGLEDQLRILRLFHILGAVTVAGAVIFNGLVILPALRRIPPAQATVVAQRVGTGLMYLGWAGLIVQGVTGIARMERMGILRPFFTFEMFDTAYGRWLGLMVLAWLLWLVAAAIQTLWFRPLLLRRMPYTTTLRDLERRRAMLERISIWQERLSYATIILALLALLAGGLIHA